MKCKIPEISWHNRDPVLSVDIQPRSELGSTTYTYRLASGGTDAHVLIWYVNLAADGSEITLDLAADLTRHQRAVNVVRWSPSGELLASGDDESVVFIWKQRAESDPLNVIENTNEQDKEVWITLKILRGHMEDVYDLSWSPNSLYLVSGSVDNTAMIWDVHKGKSLAILNDHKGFVQGVAWDPKNQYIATLSTDRYLRIFDIQTKRVLNRINKGTLPVPEGHELHGRRMHLFHDDTLQTFFRRLTFTPDGKLLLTPAGITDCEGVTRPLHTTYAFSRYNLRQPAIALPCHGQYTVAVRCCPLLFRLRPHDAEKNPPVVPLPYRMIFAVATRSSVYFYDTQQRQPFALISNIHYTRLTDATWSSDGRIVVVSSTDGFCSLITFGQGELGEIYEDAEAVLGEVLVNLGGKKTKKPKENDAQKMRKPSTEAEVAVGSVARQHLLVKIAEEKQEQKGLNDRIATPIAIKRKPGGEVQPKAATIEKKLIETDSTKEISTTLNDDAARAKLQPQATKEATNAEVTNVETPAMSIGSKAAIAAALKATVPVEIIIDKEILSSEEKFESPEKKSRPATPITVRRTPRGASAPTTDIATSKDSPTSSVTKDPPQHTTSKEPKAKTPGQQQKKSATPIAVRRKPRAIITPPTPAVDAPTVIEEAMDAWPLPMEDESAAVTSKSSEDSKTAAKSTAIKEIIDDATLDRTEDIRLVYEDTVEEAPVTTPAAPSSEVSVSTEPESSVPGEGTPKQPTLTPNKKTPRRVQLKTISTPKSKKKLLD